MDVRIRTSKVAGDLREARARGAVAALAVALGAICLRLQPLQPSVSWGVVLLVLLGVGLAVAPLGLERGAEAPVLRVLGASDREPLRFALVEGGALGVLAGVAGAVLSLVLEWILGLADPPSARLLLWPVAAGASGAFATALSLRATRHAEPLAASGRV